MTNRTRKLDDLGDSELFRQFPAPSARQNMAVPLADNGIDLARCITFVK